jgi:lipopolysaccharide export system protein LptC
MSKTRRWVIILLSLVALILIGLNLASTDDTTQQAINPDDPTYTSEHTDTVVYSPKGRLTTGSSRNTWSIFPNSSSRGSQNR